MYCFNKFSVGNLKLPNSNVGSNSPKSSTSFLDKFSVTFSSSVISSTSIFTVSFSFSLIIKLGSSLFDTMSFSDVNTSECFWIVGCKFSTDSSNSDFSSTIGAEFSWAISELTIVGGSGTSV